MWRKDKKSEAAIPADDEVSLDFSVDKDIYTKLGIQKPRRGEENALDLEKIYRYQLELDIEKINKRKGNYEQRTASYLRIRQEDPEYQQVAVTPQIGSDGDFRNVLKYTKDISWQSTTRPYGEIAHKRHLEYLANLPKGPTEQEIKDRKQRQMDKELWEKIM
jgi:hypothetical protein